MSTPKRICVYGGTFDPAATHHRQLGIELTKYYDLVIVVPCGPRTDKATVNDRSPIHRAISVYWTFRWIDRLKVDYFDLENDEFTRTHDLIARYQEMYPGSEIWIQIGADNLVHGEDGKNKIERHWAHAQRMLETCRFTVLPRPGYELTEDDLPRHCEYLEQINIFGSSKEIRTLAYHRKPFAHLVVPEVAAHIKRYDVYGGRPVLWNTETFENPQPRLLVDPKNPRAIELARRVDEAVPVAEDLSQVNILAPTCGDGGLLDLVQEHWHYRLPMVCLNAGTVGYMLNDVPDQIPADFFEQPVTLYHYPLLLVEYTTADGQTHECYGVNDAVLKVAHGMARMSIKCNGQERVPYVGGDGLIVASVLGSSAYSFSAGGPLLPLDTLDLVITGICTRGSGFESAQVPGDTVVEITNLHPDRWPTRLDVDSLPPVANVVKVTVRYSRYASIQIGSLPGVGLEAKRLRHQFPNAK